MTEHNHACPGIELTGPSPCREHGLCNLCGQPSALMKKGRIRSTARAWTIGLQWVRIRVCFECMNLLGNVLIGEASGY